MPCVISLLRGEIFSQHMIIFKSIFLRDLAIKFEDLSMVKKYRRDSDL